jgi:AmmeMemoRadiSam system protein B
MIRKAAVAGHFYPGNREQLIDFIEGRLTKERERLPAKAIVVPHAGYPYSGSVAAAVYSKVSLPRRFIIMCPNHTGLGAPVAIMSEGTWETPLGEAAIDEELAAAIKRADPAVEESALAHRDEHSLEVQLPFLQQLLDGEFKFVPLCLGVSAYEPLAELGKALVRAIHGVKGETLVISSSDMNHFESADVTIRKDEVAIGEILALRSRGLYEAVRRHRISMCGVGPTIAALEAAKALGASQGTLVAHTHSGMVTGENKRVVGYAGIVIC